MELISAAKDGNFEVAFSLITSGADLNTRDKDRATPIYWSACRGHANLCEVLVQAGCDVNARVTWGSTALHAAADRGQNSCVQILIDWGADLNAQNNRGDTPLHISAYRGFLDIIKYLIRAGANTFLRNQKDRTAQEEAAAASHVQAAKFLSSVMQDHIRKQRTLSQTMIVSTNHGYNNLDSPKDPPENGTQNIRNKQPVSLNTTPSRPKRTGSFNAARYLSRTENAEIERTPEMQNVSGFDYDSGICYQDRLGQQDCVDGVVQQNGFVSVGRNCLTPPTQVTNKRPPVYKRSKSVQEKSSVSTLNNLHESCRGDPYKISFPGMFYNVLPELNCESEGAANSFDSSYMSSTSDTTDSFNSDFTGNYVAPARPGTSQQIHPCLRSFSKEKEERALVENSSGTNEVVVGLAEELTGCRQENKRLAVEKTVLENKIITQQSVIQDISKENISLKKNLKERTGNQNDELVRISQPMTTHTELQRLLRKTKTFGMCEEEKEELHKELQIFIKEHILTNSPELSPPLDTPGREWIPGTDYVILGDKPINRIKPGQKQRSLVFLIKHLTSGRKLVLKIMLNVLNMHYQGHGDGFSLSSYLTETFSPEYSVPERLLEHAGVLKILHYFEGFTDRFKRFVTMLVNQSADVPLEMANKSLFIVTEYFPQTLEQCICDLKFPSSESDDGSYFTFLSILLYQLLALLDFIKDRNIVHRNITCDNIFIYDNLRPVLGGFGLAAALNGSDGEPQIFRSKTEVAAGDDCAWAPELIHYYNQGPSSARQLYLKDIYSKTDVFALGQVFYALLTSSKSECFYARRIQSSNARLPPLPPLLPAAVRHVIRQMVVENPAQRLTARQAMQRLGMYLFPASRSDITCQTDTLQYCNAKLLQILATESCCFRMPESCQRLSPEENVRLMRPGLEAHFLCNITPAEFWEILCEFKKLNVLL